AALAKIRQQANVGIMGDAFYDEAFCRAVVQAIGEGKELATAAGRLKFTPTAMFEAVAADVAKLEVERPSALSSNTVVTLGEKLFLKGYRRLREGLNPELEMGRFLTDVAHYPNCVPVLGALEYIGEDKRVLTLAMMQGYVSNQGDGWDHTLSYVQRFLEELLTAGVISTGATEAVEAHGGFLALIATLGQRTAELHLALALRTGDPSFDPEPLTSNDIAAFRKRASAETTNTLELLRARLRQLPEGTQADANALLDASRTLQSRIAAAASDVKEGLKTRYHGDYHLGQVLVTGNDFVIIDFEGEPARSFDERRAKSSPLRDVAGMLRSLNYARWSALRHVAQQADEVTRLDPAVREWEHATREAFLSAYANTMSAAGSSASTGAATELNEDLLALFELEKAMYELRYELNNRTDWAQVPLQGILALLKAH
ncbi:MAG: putative maltokinase, partial [Betaproteobacteria bacterium]